MIFTDRCVVENPLQRPAKFTELSSGQNEQQ